MKLTFAERACLDEIATWPEPLSWHLVTGLGLTPLEQMDAIQSLEKAKLICRAGVARTAEQNWETYRLTESGRRVWEDQVRGRRRRPKAAAEPPPWRTAQYTAATVAPSVFDLAIVPWRCRVRPLEDTGVRKYLQGSRKARRPTPN